MRLDSLFDIKNGIASSGLNILAKREDDCIPYIRPASTQQRTIAGWIKRSTVKDVYIFPPETIFVSTNGEGSHTYSYVSQFEFLPNSDVSVLIPKRVMMIQEKVFYAKCITMNRYRFSYGRKPKGERLKTIELPDVVPDWVKSSNNSNTNTAKLQNLKELTTEPPFAAPENLSNDVVRICDIFDVVYGTNLELVRMTKCRDGINFVSRTSKNNGVVARVERIDDIEPTRGGVLSVAGGGSVLETFVQIESFYSGRDLFFLRPKVPMNTEELLFYATCIRANQSRYSYGRQANRTLKDLKIPARTAIPAWVYGSINRISDQIAAMIQL